MICRTAAHHDAICSSARCEFEAIIICAIRREYFAATRRDAETDDVIPCSAVDTVGTTAAYDEIISIPAIKIIRPSAAVDLILVRTTIGNDSSISALEDVVLANASVDRNQRSVAHDLDDVISVPAVDGRDAVAAVNDIVVSAEAINRDRRKDSGTEHKVIVPTAAVRDDLGNVLEHIRAAHGRDLDGLVTSGSTDTLDGIALSSRALADTAVGIACAGVEHQAATAP